MEEGPVVLWEHEPLREPVLVIAYAGWSDGGDAATSALRHLLEQLSVERVAQIDTEDYLDFTVVRPHTRVGSDGERELLWPMHEFFAIDSRIDPPDVVLGLGVEPHLRWKHYAQAALELVRELGIRRVYMLGAYLDEVIYSQPTDVTVTSADPELAKSLGVRTPQYEGPTGILGVLGDAFGRERIPSVSLWARIPHYVSRRPNARGALALLSSLEKVSGLRFDLTSLASEAAAFDEAVAETISADPELAAYVRELKKRAFSS